MRKFFVAAFAALTTAAGATAATAAVQPAVKAAPALHIAGDVGLQTVQYYGHGRAYGHYDRRVNRDARRYYRAQRRADRRYDRYQRNRYHYDRGHYYRRGDNDAAVAALAAGVAGYALGATLNNGYSQGYSYNPGYGYNQGYAYSPGYHQPRYCYDYYGRAYAC